MPPLLLLQDIALTFGAAPLLSGAWRQSAPLKPGSKPPINRRRSMTRSGRRSVGSSRKHATRPPWPPAVTRSSTQPSVWWHANSRPAGNIALERVAHVEDRIARHDDAAALRPKVDRVALMALARDLPAAWNAPGTDARTKQRITHILIREVVSTATTSAPDHRTR